MHIHIIAIGGAIMHNLALELAAHGHQVTGSDDEIFEPAKSRLEMAGLLPEVYGWFPEKLQQRPDLVILGMHAKKDNPELAEALSLGLSVKSFPEFISEHARNKTRVVIAGSHGKTTTTAMVMHVLRTVGMEFDYLVGSRISGFERMVKLSDAPVIVLEGDEYLTSALDMKPKFLWYQPHLAQITGIAWDHINVFPVYADYVKQFRLFAESMPAGGTLAWYQGDEELQSICKEIKHLQCIPYAAPDYEQMDNGTLVKTSAGEFIMSFFGRHNLENMEGAKILCMKLGISESDFYRAMERFTGTAQRLEKIQEDENRVVYRDFAHSPSKVTATVKAVRERYPDRIFIAVLELHTFSSLQEDFIPHYKGSMDPADIGIVFTDAHVFQLKGRPMPETSFIRQSIGNVTVVTEAQKLRTELAYLPKGKQVVLFMSSGSFGKLPLLECLDQGL